jgi:hypothetical protein
MRPYAEALEYARQASQAYGPYVIFRVRDPVGPVGYFAVMRQFTVLPETRWVATVFRDGTILPGPAGEDVGYVL